MIQKLPNFFLVGAPKAGSTSLYHYLDQHPQIYMSPVKEPHYFSEEIRAGNFAIEMRSLAEARVAATRVYLSGPVDTKFSGGMISEWEDYVRLFQQVKAESAIGEASVCYLWSKTAPGNIAARFPEARILIMLRNPPERAFAQYVHAMSMAKSRFSFREHLDASFGSAAKQLGELYPFHEFGLYYEQLKRYMTLFPAEQLGIFFYEDYQREPQATMKRVFQFLGVNDAFVPDMSQRHMMAQVPQSFAVNRAMKRLGLWQLARRLSPPRLRRGLRQLAFRPREGLTLEPADRARLINFYRDDIEGVARLLDRDLSAWLQCPLC